MTTGKVEMLQTESQLTLGGSPAALLSPLLISVVLGPNIFVTIRQTLWKIQITRVHQPKGKDFFVFFGEKTT